MRITNPGVLLATALLALIPGDGLAQQAEPEPEFRYITVTRITIPATQERAKALEWVDKVMVPVARLDERVLSYRVATHNWGADSKDVVIIAEYAEWADIEGECGPCDRWFEENQPAEGTKEREEWDAMAAAFFSFFSGHSDEIYATNMTRAKN